MENIETWKDIPEYEGYYQVSDAGNIRSLDRIVGYKIEGETRLIKGINLKNIEDKCYLFVNLIKENKRKKVAISRLVATTFLGLDMSDKTKIVDHINRVTNDNTKDNLRICNTSNNAMNKVKIKNKCTSKYKGVSLDKRETLNKRWKAYIMLNGKSKKLGYFKDEIEAARKYNEVALNLFGEFSLLNNI